MMLHMSVWSSSTTRGQRRNSAFNMHKLNNSQREQNNHQESTLVCGPDTFREEY